MSFRKRFRRKCACMAEQVAGRIKGCLEPSLCSQQTIPLSESCHGGRIKICKITGDRKLCARMASIGVYPGKEAELLCPENGAQCLLKLHGATLSLDKDTSKNIIVTSV